MKWVVHNFSGLEIEVRAQSCGEKRSDRTELAMLAPGCWEQTPAPGLVITLGIITVESIEDSRMNPNRWMPTLQAISGNLALKQMARSKGREE